MSVGPAQQELICGTALWSLLLLALACFWPALYGPFVFDDFPNLQNLAQLGGRVDRSSIGLYLFSFIDNPGRPLAALSFLIEDADWPTLPLAFKRNNLLLHLLCGCFVFLLTRALARARDIDDLRACWLALACTAMWLLHPLQLSATMLVVQRMTVLSGVFVLVGLLCYLKALACDRLPQFWRVALAGTALAFFATLAFLCKENGVLAFAYASALNLTLLAPHIRALKPPYRRLLLWGTVAPLLLLAATALLPPHRLIAGYEFRDFTLGERVLTQCRILLEYLNAILLPRVGGQGVFHDDYVASRSLFYPISTAPALLGVLALLGSALWLRRLAPLYSFAVLWFFAGHLLESTVIPLELYFEHRNYLPMLGPLFALSSLCMTAMRNYKVAATAVLSVWLCTAALSTWANAGIWGDTGRLALVWANQSPGSVRAVQMLAGYHADKGEVEQAREILDAGITRLPDRTGLRVQRILLDCNDHGITDAQWRTAVTAASQAGYDRTMADVTSSFVRQANEGGCKGTLDRQDVRTLINTILRNPSYSDPDSKGFFHYELSRLALADRNLDELMRQMDLSDYYRPNPLVSREQAIYLLSAGLPDQALQYLDRSEQAPIPAFKRWLLDMPTRNAPLRASAVSMRASL